MAGGFLLKLAQQSAETFVKQQQYMSVPQMIPMEATMQRACYVTMYENPGHRFRSVYGYPLPQQGSLAQEVIVNTVGAVQNNQSGFVRLVDLKYMVFSITILGPMERITSKYHLNPQLYGLYIRSDRGKNAILLPQRTGIETPDDQIATAMRESGIEADKEAVFMYRFSVMHYE